MYDHVTPREGGNSVDFMEIFSDSFVLILLDGPSSSDPMLLFPKRTYQPSVIKRKRTHGFLARGLLCKSEQTLNVLKDWDKLSKSLIFIKTESFSHFRTLIPYPFIPNSGIFGDNLGLTEITSAHDQDTWHLG
ncbi:hypothetical protein CsSME_00052078 [Camellia sinensis var. sinensis]